MSGVVQVTGNGGLSVFGVSDSVSLRARLASNLDPLREATADEVAASRREYDELMRQAGIPPGGV